MKPFKRKLRAFEADDGKQLSEILSEASSAIEFGLHNLWRDSTAYTWNQQQRQLSPFVDKAPAATFFPRVNMKSAFENSSLTDGDS